MSINKKLRTPIIKPRTQGGTFYTFGSAMEDIGLNINEHNNRIELSHYVLLDIPGFDASVLSTSGKPYDASLNKGDYIFAESFQDYVLNMETVLRNQETYNYAANSTVSERVFWKWLTKHYGLNYASETIGGKTYYYDSSVNPIAKAYGRIYSGSQRSDEYGLYNETFVQIPSSYGSMKMYYSVVKDENYAPSEYTSSNGKIIENISSSEYVPEATDQYCSLNATGISALGIFDKPSYKYDSSGNSTSYFFQAVLDINTLRNIYNDQTLSYDDIGFGRVDSSSNTNFTFNAILVYYSIYDSTGTNLLATNAYGLYVLNNSILDTSETKYYFPRLNKIKTTTTVDGTSFSFRLNIKPSSAYSGDITVSDNSTGGFSMSEDFNDVVRNLNSAINVIKSNSRVLKSVVDNNRELMDYASDTIDRVNDIEHTVNILSDNGYMWKDCDDIINIIQGGIVTEENELHILAGDYKNIRLSNGNIILRTTFNSNSTVFLSYDELVFENNQYKHQKKTHMFTKNSDETYTKSGIYTNLISVLNI